MDYFGDGSVYIIDAPGYEEGHISILACTFIDGAWICLAADSAHNPRVIRGEKNIPQRGMYADAEISKERARNPCLNMGALEKN